MLTDTVNTYLSVRRTVGFKLKTVESYLWSYANFATARGDIRVVSKTAIEWAELASSEDQRANRLNVLIRFARFARAEDYRHEIPPENIFCGHWHRRTPYIFTDEEVRRLVLYASRLSPPGALRPYTYSTLFGLLASTGLRISEALSLRFQDVTRKDWLFAKRNSERAASYGFMRLSPWLSNIIFSVGVSSPTATITSLSHTEVTSSHTRSLPTPSKRFSKSLAFKVSRVAQSLGYTV
jgi:integrase